MSAPPAEIPPPFTFEEAQVLFCQNALLIAGAVHECAEVSTVFSYRTTRSNCVRRFIHCLPPHWPLQPVNLFSCNNADFSSKEKLTLSGSLAALTLAAPASIFFGLHILTSTETNRRFGAVYLLSAVGVYV
jgi:hypothetical protein